MKAVIQKVKYATVKVDNKIVGKINNGFLIFLGITHSDDEKDLEWLASKIKNLRIFEDNNNKLNLSIEEVKGEILIISQFTLYADCIKGRRPSFINAAKPEFAKKLYENFIEKIKSYGIKIENGMFGADMKVELLNDGPVTIIIDTADANIK